MTGMARPYEQDLPDTCGTSVFLAARHSLDAGAIFRGSGAEVGGGSHA